MSEPIKTDTSSYIFRGHKFLPYISTEEFKDQIKQGLNFQFADGESIPSIYKRFRESAQPNWKIHRIFFEQILYGRLTNVFIHKIINDTPTVVSFKEKVKKLIDRLNERQGLSEDIKDSMSETGFYLMDAINTSKKIFFIAGYDLKVLEDKVEKARFLIVQVVPIGSGETRSTKFLVGSLEIDYSNKICLISMKNLTDINKEENDDFEEEIPSSVTKFHNKIKDLFFPLLSLTSKIDMKSDRKAMFEMCKELDDGMLSEMRTEIERKVSFLVEDSVEGITNELLPKTYLMTEENKETFIKRINSLLLATYMNIMVDDEDLARIAKERNLVGYPTKISFRSETAAQGSTGSSGADDPVATSIMFHSLYTDFEEALELPYWSLSWFQDIENLSGNIAVVQTSITSTTKYFKIVFLNGKSIGKELLYHVVRNLSGYRNY